MHFRPKVEYINSLSHSLSHKTVMFERPVFSPSEIKKRFSITR